MSEAKQYIQNLFTQKKITIASNRASLFEEYVKNDANINAVKLIQDHQKLLMAKWELQLKIKDIIDSQLIIPNATVNKSYHTILNFEKLGMNDLDYTEFEGLEQYGLHFNNETKSILGTPTQSGDFKFKIKFRIKGEDVDSALNEKQVSLVINADPKSLWKEIPSEQKEDNYWKPDNFTDFQPLGHKHIVVSSKRGRSHANIGSFRDDDFAFKHFEQTGWSIVCVADGAGSAKLSRQGSKLACEGIISYFEKVFVEDLFKEFDTLIKRYYQSTSEASDQTKRLDDEQLRSNEIDNNEIKANFIDKNIAIEPTNPEHEIQKEIKLFLYNNLGKASLSVHRNISEFANDTKLQLKDFHTTLIFALFKKYEFGYAVLSFGVGDCPIGLLNKDMTELKLMNWLDVGEFGGGTRFITMPEIFSSDKFSSRFGFKLINDFSYLMLMTDGIYDPKFDVEVNLEKIEIWKEFLDDLNGNNEEKIKIDFDPENKEITNQLSTWMDFWSPGNHDDRTLAIVF